MCAQKQKIVLILWMFLIVPNALAQAESFTDTIWATDYKSLVLAATVALIVSAIRTVVTLFSDKPVYQVRRQIIGDLMVAFCAGGVAFMVLEVLLQEGYWHPKRMTRLVLIGIAGSLRWEFFTWGFKLVRNFMTNISKRTSTTGEKPL